MKRGWIAALVTGLLLLTLACGETTPTPAIDWQAPVDALFALTAPLSIPAHLMEGRPPTAEDFDPNTYFTVLDRLTMEEGYVLDYVYYLDFLGGAPVLYARPVEQPPYTSEAELPTEQAANYLDHVRAEDSAEGFYQHTLLRLLGGRFYIYWHAGYGDIDVLANEAALTTRLTRGDDFGSEFPRSVRNAARRLNPTPTVTLEEEHVTVTLLTYSNWRGFERHTFTLRRAFPHTLLHHEREVVVEYHCGVVF